MKKIAKQGKIYTIALLFFLGLQTQGAIIFTKAESPYYITEDYIVENSDSIIFQSGATLILSPSTSIITNGVIIIEGLPEDRVSFLPEVEGTGWGKLDINCPDKTSIIRYATVVDGSILSWYCDMDVDNLVFYNSQILPWNNPLLYVRTASATITNSSIYGGATGEGFVLENSEVAIVKNCFFNQIPDAIEYINITGGNIRNNRFEWVLDDAIDLNNCTNTLIDSNVILNVVDRGMEIGSEGFGDSENILVRRNVIVGCRQGVTFKEDSYGHVINNTFYGNKVGVYCIVPNTPRAGSYIDLQNCILSNSIESDFYHDTNSIISINYCLSDNEILPGNNNILDDPIFVNELEYDFNLQEGSPCINSGNPILPPDPDGSISDMGAYFFDTDTTNIYFNNLISSFEIFPNPFLDHFTIKHDNKSSPIIELFNFSGTKISSYEEKIQTGEHTITKVTPNPRLKPNTIIICRVSIYGYSNSYQLLHK